MRQGEYVADQHFLLFLQCFLIFFSKPNSIITGADIYRVQMISNWTSLNILSFDNSSPNDKILDWSKLKAFADNKINETEKLKFVLGVAENTVGKGENAGYQHFLLLSQCFQKLSFSGVVKSQDCVVKG